jgi:type I restriction enzyme S subunit
MSWGAEEIRLDDQSRFETLNGLWTGKKPPYMTAGVIRDTNFTESGRIDYSHVAWLQVEQKQLVKRQLKPGDIIVERSGGGPKQPVGRVVYFTREDGPFSFSNFTSVIRVRDAEAFDAKFVFYRLLELYQSGRTEDIQRRTTGIRNLDFTAYKERATLPQIPRPEQLIIAGVLEVVQRAIEQQERLLALTAELKNALLHKLFTEGLRGEPQKQTEIGPVPESWEVVKLSDVCTFQSGGTPSKQRPDFWEGTIPWVSPKDMKRPRLVDVIDHISDEALEEGSKLAPAGSVFVVVRGMILAKDVPVALAEVPMAINQDMKAIIPGPRVSAAFLLYAMAALKQKLFEKVGRSAHGTMTLMSTEIAGFQIPLPDKQTQHGIAYAIETLEKKHELHRRRLAALTALFRTMLHQLMTAQIRVHDLDLDLLECGDMSPHVLIRKVE